MKKGIRGHDLNATGLTEIRERCDALEIEESQAVIAFENLKKYESLYEN